MLGKLAATLSLAALFTVPIFAFVGDTRNVAADGGTQTTLTGSSAVILKQRDGRKFGQIVALKANTTNASCALMTVKGTDPTATATQIILAPGDSWGACSSGGTCFGGSVACIAVSGSPIVTSTDY